MQYCKERFCNLLFFFQFFTATFAVEAVMKLMAMSPKFYFKESGTFSENSNLFWFAFAGGLEHL